MTCLIESQRKLKAENMKLKENNTIIKENNREFTNGNKRPREIEVMKEEKKDRKEKIVNYVGETSRSGYERSKEHFNDFDKMYKRSHILRHYLEYHKNIKLEDLDMRIRVLGRYKSAFEQQLRESVWLNRYLREGVEILNSKNEYNRCSIPRLGLSMIESDEYEEKQKEMNLRSEIEKL